MAAHARTPEETARELFAALGAHDLEARTRVRRALHLGRR
jgi:hypothetical protein